MHPVLLPACIDFFDPSIPSERAIRHDVIKYVCVCLCMLKQNTSWIKVKFKVKRNKRRKGRRRYQYVEGQPEKEEGQVKFEK